VKKRFPDTETKLLIGCSNGSKYSMDALMALDEEGYTNLTGLKVLLSLLAMRLEDQPAALVAMLSTVRAQ
jgi:hypothetical protein